MPTQAPEAPPLVESERAGSRWLHAQPSEADVRAWFETQRLHPGMEHGPYVSGLVLIGAKEKVNVTKKRVSDGLPFVTEVEQAVFVPYVKVDTRIAYFRDYVRLLNAVDGEPREYGDYYGVIRPVAQVVIQAEDSAYYNGNLPAGFTVHPVRVGENTVIRYLIATYEAAIFRRGEQGQPDRLVARGQGSKQTGTKRGNYAEDNAVMKAETGAIGRALGVLGMLVVGTGVATAEDVQESLAATPGAAAGVSATLPPIQVSDVTTPAMIAEVTPPPAEPVDALGGEDFGPALTLPDDNGELRQLALDLRQEMEAKFPDAWALYVAWWTERGYAPLDELEGPALRGVVIKLQRDLDACKQPSQ